MKQVKYVKINSLVNLDGWRLVAWPHKQTGNMEYIYAVTEV